MPDPPHGHKPMSKPAKMMAIAAVCLLLGLGLCGTGMAFEDFKAAGPLIMLGAISFYGGALLLVIGFVRMLIDNSRRANR